MGSRGPACPHPQEMGFSYFPWALTCLTLNFDDSVSTDWEMCLHFPHQCPLAGRGGSHWEMLGPLVIFFFFLNLFIIYWFLATLSLHCCLQFFSTCRAWGLLSSCSERTCHRDGFSCWGHRPWSVRVSLVVAPKLSGLVTRGIFLDKGLNQRSLH